MLRRIQLWRLLRYGWLAMFFLSDGAVAQQISLAFSSVDSPNANWYIAKEKSLYKKYGLDADLIFIPSSTTTIAAVVAGSVTVGNISGGATANAAVGGANVVAVGCFINTLPYDLVVHESIRSAQQLKGKAIGISRVGSSSDVAARAFLKELKLEPDKDVAILQVGGSTERAAAFRTGRIIAFPAPPGTIHLAQGMPHRVLISMADFPKGFPFPYVCPTLSKSYLRQNRDAIKRLMMALIDGVHFYKTRKDESKKIMAKFTRHNNEAFLEDAYQSSAKLFEQVPLVNREGMDVQVKDAVSRKPGSQLKVDDLIDDSLVLELEKEGFINRIYKQ
ncbi:MAG: ABC transporter substrate-binding protein [Deltaproteobacteria bacterium]|nr:ABC transporter substrate-binding protein [Deltaproteobacteria bacterium]